MNNSPVKKHILQALDACIHSYGDIKTDPELALWAYAQHCEDETIPLYTVGEISHVVWLGMGVEVAKFYGTHYGHVFGQVESPLNADVDFSIERFGNEFMREQAIERFTKKRNLMDQFYHLYRHGWTLGQIKEWFTTVDYKSHYRATIDKIEKGTKIAR